MIRRPPGRLGSDPIEPQAREVESLNKGVDRPNRIALIDPVLQTLGKQRRLPAIDPLNEASHLIPPQIAAESYSANQIIQCVFTQRGSDSVIRRCLLNVRFGSLLGLKSDISRGPSLPKPDSCSAANEDAIRSPRRRSFA